MKELGINSMKGPYQDFYEIENLNMLKGWVGS